MIAAGIPPLRLSGLVVTLKIPCRFPSQHRCELSSLRCLTLNRQRAVKLERNDSTSHGRVLHRVKRLYELLNQQLTVFPVSRFMCLIGFKNYIEYVPKMPTEMDF